MDEARALHGDYDHSAEEAAELLLPTGGGCLISVMSAKQSQKMATFLVGRARHRVILTAFTYDLLVVTQALKQAASRGVLVSVVVDQQHVLNGVTTDMIDQLDELKVADVDVYVTRGLNSSGIQHSKTLPADSSSRTNHEVSVLLALSTEGLAAYDKKFAYMMESGRLLSEAELAQGRQARERRKASRGKSVLTRDQYATAKRFSIARGRSAQRANDSANGIAREGEYPS